MRRDDHEEREGRELEGDVISCFKELWLAFEWWGERRENSVQPVTTPRFEHGTVIKEITFKK